MTSLLSVRNLQASYGPAQVLFNVSFDVGVGEVVTLLGRNGMGRSTTIKCLFGLLPVKDGEIQVEGVRCEHWPSHQIARMGLGLVPEGRQVFPNLTVEENLTATARKTDAARSSLKQWDLARIYRLFPRLEQRRSNMGNQLSGGEQQMLAISRALMTNPRLLVLDEATEGLSPLVRTEIWNALTALKKEGLSMIVVDKHLGALCAIADRHCILEKGSLVWHGDTAALKASPETVHRYLGV
ncbi:MAG: ABC transporter ATP-binding protein [Polaromonas sp.]|nr:ABC transporter ATP-binding protein [Polaromonas sp.]